MSTDFEFPLGEGATLEYDITEKKDNMILRRPEIEDTSRISEKSKRPIVGRKTPDAPDRKWSITLISKKNNLYSIRYGGLPVVADNDLLWVSKEEDLPKNADGVVESEWIVIPPLSVGPTPLTHQVFLKGRDDRWILPEAESGIQIILGSLSGEDESTDFTFTPTTADLKFKISVNNALVGRGQEALNMAPKPILIHGDPSPSRLWSVKPVSKDPKPDEAGNDGPIFSLLCGGAPVGERKGHVYVFVDQEDQQNVTEWYIQHRISRVDGSTKWNIVKRGTSKAWAPVGPKGEIELVTPDALDGDYPFTIEVAA